MELTPAQLQALQTLSISSGKSRNENLSVGQQILAKVVATNNVAGEVTLNLNNVLLNAKTSLSLPLNQSLQLTVLQNGNQLLLQLPEKIVQTAVMQQTLREALPQQKPVSQLVNQLQQFLQQAKNINAAQPVIQAARKFIHQLPSVKQLSNAQGLKIAIQQSGLFLERNLLKKTSDGKLNSLSHDLKSMLMNMKSVISRQQSVGDLPAASQSKANTSPTSGENPSLKAETVAKPIRDSSKEIVKSEIKTVSQQSPQSQESTQNKASNPPNPQSVQFQKPITQNPATASAAQTTQQAPTKFAQDQNQATQNKTESGKQPISEKPEQLNESGKSVSKHDAAPPPSKNITPQMIRHILKAPLPDINPQSSQTQARISVNSATVNMAYKEKPVFDVKDALAFNPAKESAARQTGSNRVNNLFDMLDNLVKTVDSAISRVQLHQLHSLQESETGKLAWSLEIPVRDEDEHHLVHMELEQERHNDRENENIVTVNLAVDLQTLGPVYARITLISDNVGVVLWAEREDTFALAQSNITELQTNLHKSGFKSENISCHQGCPPQSRVIPLSDTHSLLDIKA